MAKSTFHIGTATITKSMTSSWPKWLVSHPNMQTSHWFHSKAAAARFIKLIDLVQSRKLRKQKNTVQMPVTRNGDLPFKGD